MADAQSAQSAQSAITRRLLATREQWLELDPEGTPNRRALLVRRPAETELSRLRNGIDVEDAARACVGWRGFTEAALLGPALGSQDTQVPFLPDLCLEVLRDNAEWVNAVTERMATALQAHIAARLETRKN